jgi:NhaA family Na+:H+ antiporter
VPRERDERRALAVIRPLPDFLYVEAAGGAVLIVAIVAALVWANVGHQSYEELWTTTFTVGFPDHHLTLTLREWVNDGLMTIFFFVVGLEIKRELVEGELRDPRKAAMPAIAAVGGMVVPALIYVAFNAGGVGSHGWGIPMATDIAIAIGVLTLIGRRVPAGVKLFLLTLAIVDDVGAILVIVVFYSSRFGWGSALGAVGVILVMIGLRHLGVWNVPVYVVLGAVVWLLVHESGVHATLVGVALGLITPTRGLRHPEMVDADKLTDVSTVEDAYETVAIARESVSVVDWLEYRLHPASSYLIVPVFALANAGVVISRDSIDHAVSSPVTQGIVVGLVVGKFVGIAGSTWLASRLRVAALPDAVGWRHVCGIAALGGVGFTVSLFVAQLAFGPAGRLTSDAKLGILAASIVAAVLGAGALLVATRTPGPRGTSRGPGV